VLISGLQDRIPDGIPASSPEEEKKKDTECD